MKLYHNKPFLVYFTNISWRKWLSGRLVWSSTVANSCYLLVILSRCTCYMYMLFLVDVVSIPWYLNSSVAVAVASCSCCWGCCIHRSNIAIQLFHWDVPETVFMDAKSSVGIHEHCSLAEILELGRETDFSTQTLQRWYMYKSPQEIEANFTEAF